MIRSIAYTKHKSQPVIRVLSDELEGGYDTIPLDEDAVLYHLECLFMLLKEMRSEK